MNRAARLALAGGVAVFAALWALLGDPVGALFSLFVVALASALVIAVAVYLISNLSVWSRAIRGISHEDHLKRLEEEGKAIREHYQVSRSISAEDLSTGCHLHLLDIGDRRLLCLYGQDYYDFEPIEDDADAVQPRKFPTREFSLLRRKSNGEVLALFPGRDAFEPTTCGGIVGLGQALGMRLVDGEITPNKSFEDVELACRSAEAHARVE